MIRAKFKVDSYTTFFQKKEGQPVEMRTVNMSPVYGGSEENRKFFAFTPSGRLELCTLNPEAWAQFELGKEYYIDFTRA